VYSHVDVRYHAWGCVGHFIDKIPVLGRGHYEQIPGAVTELSHQQAVSVTVVVDLKLRSLAIRCDSNEKDGVMRVREGLAHVNVCQGRTR